MYCKIVWCYTFILTLLDITLNTKLTAQGKSHGVSVQDTFAEGVTFQEWGTEEQSEEHEHERDGGGVSTLLFTPSALRFGAVPLGVARSATVMLHNTANSTLHLASVSGSTSDFYASFFETKSVPPEANTTFSVVYVGRREGYVGAHLYVHTSRGVHRFPVSATGLPSDWGLWPLVGLRVPQNATLQAHLRLSNPTAAWVQVQEVYSSAGWLRLALPGGEPKAPQASWLLPPHGTREVVRMLIALPDHVYSSPPKPPVDSPNVNPLTGYIRIKLNVTEPQWGGGSLLLAVEVRTAAAGHYAEPLQLRLSARGTDDPPDSWQISVGNSGGESARAEGGVWAARCSPRAASLPDPFAAAAAAAPAPHANGAKPEGAQLVVTRPFIEPYQELTPTARFTLDYGKLGEALERALGGTTGARAAAGGWCGGWLRLGGAALHYSVRLLPGTARLSPADVRVVTAARELALREHELRLTNEFALPLRVARLDVPRDVAQHFIVSDLWEGVLSAGSSGVVGRLRLRRLDAQLSLDSALTLQTNVTRYSLPLAVYSGYLEVEWEWVNATGAALELGVVGLSSTRHVALRVRNPAPRALCVTSLDSELLGAQLALDACAHLKPKPVPADHACRCVAAGGSARGVLTVVAPARRGLQRGVVALHTPHARMDTVVSLRAEPGRLAVPALLLDPVAPYAWATADLVVDSTMDLSMRVLDVVHGGDGAPDPAVEFLPGREGGEVREGRRSVGVVRYAAERLCEPACYTGLSLDEAEGARWEERAARWDAAALAEDAALLRARRALFAAARGANVSLVLHTTHALHVRVRGATRPRWPRLAGPAAKGWAGLTGVGAQAALRLAVRNPSPSHRLLLQPALGAPLSDAPTDLWEGGESPYCLSEPCAYSADAFRLGEWRVTRGAARLWRPAAPAASPAAALPLLLLEPNAELELKVLFAPPQAALLSAYLYLRNNLTVLEGLQLAGRGAVPSFEIAGRQPGSAEPVLFEVTECGTTGPAGAGEAAGPGGVVRVSVTARNSGRVAVRLRDWRVAGRACAARGFSVLPCQPLQLAPNQTAQLWLAFTPDWTLGHAHAELLVHTDLGPARFQLAAIIPAPLLPRCAGVAHKTAPPLEWPLRFAATVVALALVVLVMAAAALDAERLLRKARQQRQPAPAARAPLDLRHVAQHAPCPPPAPAPRAPPPRRRRARKPDPAAESRAFERWRAALARHDDDESRSSEDADADDASLLEPGPPPARAPRPDLPAPDDGGDTADERSRSSSGDDDAPSSGEESLSPPEQDDDDARPPTPPRESSRATRAPARDRSPASARAAPASPEGDEAADPLQPAADAPGRPRARPPGDAARRELRRADADAARPRSAAKHHLRKDKPKRRERPPPTPPRSSPPTLAPGEARPPQPSPPGSAPPGVRWGASWSSVVARSNGGTASPPAPLAPIGSDVRRREPEAPAAPRPAAGHHSLFFFNGDTPSPPVAAAAPAALPHAEPDFSWRPPQPDRSAFAAPANDYLASAAVSEEAALGSVGGAYGSIGRSGPVWGGALEARAPGAAWPWPAFAGARPPRPPDAVRPPPGFGAPAAPTAPEAGAARPFDPFRSLAAIWTPSSLDWRSDPADAD